MDRSARTLLVVLVFVLFVMGVPLAMYVSTFGTDISQDHERWAAFGSAMAGIYAPVAAFGAIVTLIALVKQVGLQRQMNDHYVVQARVVQARSDIDFYCGELVRALEAEVLPGRTVRAQLRLHFEGSTVEALDEPGLRTMAADFDGLAPNVLALWMGVYPVLAGLNAEHLDYRIALNSSRLKLIALLGFGSCVALDHYHRARTGGKLEIEYRFSPLLSPD